MLTIIIGIIITVAILVFLEYIAYKTNDFCLLIVEILFASFGLLTSLLLGMYYPFSGYNDWELVSETPLVGLSNTTASVGSGYIYVSISPENAYTYRYEIDSDFGTESSKEYKTATVTGNVVEIEDPACEVPVLRKYEQTAKKSIWTFGLTTIETKYVFYVPEGTIIKEVKLQ